MKRVILFIIVTGAILWGMIAVCSYAEVQKDPELNASVTSIAIVRLHPDKEGIRILGRLRQSEFAAETGISFEGRLIYPSRMTRYLLAKKYGNYCNTPTGCWLETKKEVGEPCVCSHDQSVGRVLNKKRKKPKTKPVSNAEDENDEADNGSGSTDSTLENGLIEIEDILK